MLTTNAEPMSVGRGFGVFLRNCVGCHNSPGYGGGAIPDLGRSDDAIFDSYEAILLEGALAQLGMPIRDNLSRRDVDDVRNFVIFAAQSLREGVEKRELNETLTDYHKLAVEADEAGLDPDPTRGAQAETAPVQTAEAPSAAPAASAAAGEQAAAICRSCHTFDQGGRTGVGPNLWGVVGRDIASVEGFRYSPALTAMEGAWTVEKLDGYVKAPMQYAPGTMMAVGLSDDQRRADLIEYLKTLSEE